MIKVNKNIIRIKTNKIKYFNLKDIKKLRNWIFKEGKKPKYISVENKPINLNFYFLKEMKNIIFPNIFIEYLTLKELKKILQTDFYFIKEKENINNNNIISINRFKEKNYKTIYKETGIKINKEKEIKEKEIKNFWISKKKSNKNKILIIDCEMVEIIDIKNKTNNKIKTISFNYLKLKENNSKINLSPKLKISSQIELTNKYNKENSYKKHIARITIININGELILDKYITPRHPIINFHTKESGITKSKLNSSISLIELYKELDNIIFIDTILVGHSISNDLLSLSINHKNIIDTSRLFSNRGYKNSLKKLSKKYLKKDIQIESHSSLEDCLATRDLLLLKYNQYKNILSSKRYSDIPINVINNKGEIKDYSINIINIKNIKEIINFNNNNKSINIIFVINNSNIYFKIF